jgi:signal transduction histidine kinase
MLSQRSLSQQASLLEERLAQEQRLTQRQQDFVSMASHEFRTPLTVIDGQAQRLIKIAARLSPDDVRERASRIRTAVLRMTTTMEHLLNSARLTEGEPELFFHPTELDLRAVLDEVCLVHREIAPQGYIWQKFAGGPMRLRGDARLLSQAFGNLISNALKYSPDGSLIEVVAAREGDSVTVGVIDRGMGIPQQDLPNIFERYTRGSNVSGIVGTGVGLFFVKVVVELHGGSVAVESKQGTGTKFTVRLPVLPAPKAAEAPVAGSEASRESEVVTGRT